MIESIDALSPRLRATVLAGRPVRKLWPFCSPAHAFAIDLDTPPTQAEWEALTPTVRRLGRYPILTSRDHLGALFYDAQQQPPIHPDDDLMLQRAADSLTISAARNLAAGGPSPGYSPTQTSDLFDWLDAPVEQGDSGHPVAQTLKRFGEAPTIQEIRDLRTTGRLRTDADLERWLWDWELERFGAQALVPPDLRYLDGWELSHDSACTALLLPIRKPWQALLYMGWYGAWEFAVEQPAVLRRWERRHGAELTRAFGTTLHMRVRRRPQTIDEAFALAVEHYVFASDTLNGPQISLREHARALLAVDHWYFHSRP